MSVQQNNQTEQDFQKSQRAARSTVHTGLNAAKNTVKNGEKAVKAGKKAVEVGVKVGKAVAEMAKSIITFLIENPLILVILLIIVILLIAVVLSLDGGWMRKDSDILEI